MIIEIKPHTPQPRKLKRAVEALDAGEIVAYPTDPGYALGRDLANQNANDRLYQLKGMERKHALAFICSDLADVSKYAIVDNHAYRLLRRLLPGPYTFILTATREVPKILHTSDRRTVGIRVPDAPIIVEVVRALGRPVISTTAHKPGDEHMVIDARDIEPTFPGVDLVLDGGIGGREPTTVVDLSHGSIDIVREGAGPIDALVQ